MKTKSTRIISAPERNRFAIYIFSDEPAGAPSDSPIHRFTDSTKIPDA
ncbi:MAG TPA: hypothetical protein VII71_01155 [Verrucomicrobiae bacterium]